MDNPVKSDDQLLIIEEKVTKSNGEIIIKKYQRNKLLGKGGFAKCYEIMNIETKKIYAAKIIAKNTLTKNRSKQKLISEIKIHKALNQPNIVNFEHVFENHENVFILLEICTNQTLNELLKRRKRLTELEVQCYLIQLLYAIKYLHDHRVIHRDLKLGNLFLSDKMEIKVGDFGLATKLEFEGELKRTVCGTPNYIAPEILDGKRGHSYEVDVWSLGVIIYTLLIGKPPYETPDVKTTYKKIKMNSYTFPDHVPISEPAKDLISKILNLDPAKRPKIDDMLDHKFFNNGGSIPKLLPLSTLACPPSSSYQKQFLTQGNTVRATQQPRRVENDENALPRSQTCQINEAKKLQSYQSARNLRNTNNNKQQGDIWISKWVDYSSKYGLGYMLSDGSTGVYFNDATKVILHPSGTYFEYLQKQANEKNDFATQYNFDNYPKDLKKKVTLLQHFKNYLENENKFSKDETNINRNTPLVYMKKWMKTKHAVMFRLSNKIVQVNFTDKTEVILCSETKLLTYVNKKGERTNYPLATALESENAEMIKRLKYTKEILAHMMNNGAQPLNEQRQIIIHFQLVLKRLTRICLIFIMIILNFYFFQNPLFLFFQIINQLFFKTN